jgi:hypothetical protein
MTIGNASSTTTISGTGVVGGVTHLGNAITTCSSLNNAGGALTIGATTTGMTIGNASSTTTISGTGVVGGVTHLANAITTCSSLNNAGGALTIGATTTGMTIGNASSTTTISGTGVVGGVTHLGNAITTCSSINNAAGALTIGATTTGMTIGNASSTTTISGTGVIGGITHSANAITSCATINNNGSTLNIGVTTTGMSIGSTASTNTINGLGVIGGIGCFNNAMADCSQINNSASTDLALGNTQVAGVLNLGTGATRTGNINLGASGWATGVVNTYRPIAPQYTPVVAGSSPAATTTPGPGQIGYTIAYTALQNTANFGATPAQVIQQYTNVIDKGIWHCSVSLGLDLTTAGGGTWFSYRVSIVNQTAGSVTLANSCNQTPGITLGFAFNNLSTQCVSAIIVANGLTSIQIIPELNYSSGTFRPSAEKYVLFFTKIA